MIPGTFSKIALPGDVVTCDKGHEICTMVESLADPVKLSMFKDWQHGLMPVPGETMSRRCPVAGCDGVWLSREGLCRRVATRAPIVAIGDKVTCPDGHPITVAIRDVYQVVPFNVMNFAPTPPGKRCEECGAKWLDEVGARICIDGKWRK